MNTRTGAGRRIATGTVATVVVALAAAGCGSRSGTTSAAQGVTAPTEAASPSASAPQLVRYSGAVEHLAVGPLIADPHQAFASRDRDRLNAESLTTGEFTQILEELYDSDYALVDPASLVQVGATGLSRTRLLLPPGKKPLVLSVDDLAGYPWQIAAGLTSRLVLDRDGDVAAERQAADGRSVVARNNDVVPIVDRFVEQHPDFSVDGAKGALALTGRAGVLGYRTSTLPVTGVPAPEQAIVPAAQAAAQRRSVAPVIRRLKATGWTFAANGYAGSDLAGAKPAAVAADTRNWRREVGRLVGATSLYVLPGRSPLQPAPATLQALTKQQFSIFYAPDALPGLIVTPTYARQNYVHLDGTALVAGTDELRRLFDPDSVLDPARPPLRVAPPTQRPTN